MAPGPHGSQAVPPRCPVPWISNHRLPQGSQSLLPPKRQANKTKIRRARLISSVWELRPFFEASSQPSKRGPANSPASQPANQPAQLASQPPSSQQASQPAYNQFASQPTSLVQPAQPASRHKASSIKHQGDYWYSVVPGQVLDTMKYQVNF